MTTEDRLRETLRTRAESVRVSPGAWARIEQAVHPRPVRRRYVATAGVLALVAALVAAVLVVSQRHDGDQVRVVTPPGPAAPAVHSHVWLLRQSPTPTAEVIDTATGARRTVALTGLLPYGTILGGTAFRRDGDIVLVQLPGDRNPSMAYAIGPDGAARPIAPAGYVVPADTDDRFWAIAPDDTARQLDLAGRQTGTAAPFPAGFVARAPVDGGLAGYERRTPTSALSDVAVWDATTGGVRRLGANGTFVAAHGKTVAWADVPLHVALEKGDLVVNPRPDYHYAGVGSFSPDGETLLAWATKGPQAVLIRVDTVSRRTSKVGGSEIRMGGFTSLGWSADGQTFFFLVSDANNTTNRLYRYRRVTNSVTKTSIVTGRFDASALVP
jgi:hypothetical protein